MNVEDELKEKPASEELCRLCANPDKQLIPIFQGEGIEHNIAEQIKKYIPVITVTKVDKLPLQICYQCTSTLIAWHNFFEQCRVADNRLREILSENEKFNQDDESCHDFADNFCDDFEDKATVDGKTGDDTQKEAAPSESTVCDVQIMEISDNNTIDISKDVKSVSENLSDSRFYYLKSVGNNSSVPSCSRCLRMTNKSAEKQYGHANMLGTRGRRHSKSEMLQVEDAIVAPPTDIKLLEKECLSSICPCIWSNYNDCSQCAPYNKFRCAYCPMVFLETQLRNRHMRKTHQDRLFDYCFNWLYENSLKSRIEVAPLEEEKTVSTFQCNECAATFFDKKVLIKHLRIHKTNEEIEVNSDVFLCDHCSVTSATKVALIAHLRLAHADIFGDLTAYGVEAAQDGAKERNTDFHKCDVCGRIFRKRSSLIRHQNSHSSGQFACSKREKRFASEKALSDHNLRRHKKLPKNALVANECKYLKCDRCSFTCRNGRSKFEDHVRLHTGEKPFTCETCGKQFRTRSHLGTHQRCVHDGVKKFACDICERCFSSRRYMEDHRRIHTGEKPLICHLCGQSFRQSSSLQKHVDSHMGVKRHACHLCSNRYSSIHRLNFHIKRHMGVATHVCTQCGKAFVDQRQLRDHYVVHSEARPHVCPQCGAGFKLRKHLIQHGRTHRFLSSSKTVDP
ncbi:hypothetical protein V9T40_006781 [Parthenolecanium corni]|uniref:Uncharacterized protein n=1 Tax=Parthenolecanium corni TaxID=536013 RepID=A0AAN9Y9L0_9HEMI